MRSAKEIFGILSSFQPHFLELFFFFEDCQNHKNISYVDFDWKRWRWARQVGRLTHLNPRPLLLIHSFHLQAYGIFATTHVSTCRSFQTCSNKEMPSADRSLNPNCPNTAQHRRLGGESDALHTQSLEGDVFPIQKLKRERKSARI